MNSKKKINSLFALLTLTFSYRTKTPMAMSTRNISIDGVAVSSIYLWILLAVMSSPARILAHATNDRIDDPTSSSAAVAASSATQLRLSHLQNNVEPHTPNTAYLVDSSPYYQASPMVNRLFSRYNEAKRSWNNLQSSWGKRDAGENLFDSNGSGDLTPDEYADLLLLLSKPYGVDFTGARFPADDNNNNGEQPNDDEFFGGTEKRAWNKMNAAWGKRLAGGRNNNGEDEFRFHFVSSKLIIVFSRMK